MTSPFPTDDQLAAYRASMEAIFRRLHQARETLAVGATERVVEVAALDLRKALEGLLLSSLVTHLDSLEPIKGALHRQKPSDARRLVERLIQIGGQIRRTYPLAGRRQREWIGRSVTAMTTS